MLNTIVSYFVYFTVEMIGLDDSLATVRLPDRVCIYHQGYPQEHKPISDRSHSMVAQLIFKIYKLMRSYRSNQKLPKRDCVFAVYPISVSFSKQYRHNYILYFERNLHIFSRYQFNERMIVKDKRFYFELPTTIQSHVISSPQELQFKWSLYEERLLDNYTQQQFMESKKANLKWCWQVYSRNQIKVHSAEAVFGVIKVQMTYLFVIANSNEQILDSLAAYYKQNNIVPSKLKKKLSKLTPLKDNTSEEILYSETHSIEGIVKEESRFDASNIYISTPIERSSLGESLKKTFESPSLFEAEESQALKQTQKSQSKGLIKVQRSISDMKEYAGNSNRLTENQEERLIRSLSIAEEREQMVQVRRGPFRSETINYFQIKAITASQYFNEQGKLIIEPFYFQAKYWLVIFAVLFIFIWVVDQGPKHHTHPLSSKSHHPKEKQLHSKSQRIPKPQKKQLNHSDEQQQLHNQKSSRRKDKQRAINKETKVQKNQKIDNYSSKSIKKHNRKINIKNNSIK